MRRLVLIGAALAVLGAAAAAYAASNYNNYTGSNLKISKGSGALSLVQTLIANAPSGDRAAPLQDIKYKIYGVKLDTGKLPVCTVSKIESNKANPDGGCSPGSVIGNGPTHSELGPGTDPSSASGTPCNPFLHIFNGGPKTQILYFYTKSATDCGGLTTGATAPYTAHISYSHGWAIIDVPQPPDISTKVANQPNFYGSLISATYSFGKKVGGKAYMTSVACKSHKRPWSITFTDQKYNGGGSETQTIKGTAAC